MSCKKGTRNTPQAIIDEIIRKHKEGTTRKELAEFYEKPFDTIKSMIKRENEKQRKLDAGLMLKKKGRPPKGYVISEEDKVAELRYKINRKDYRIKQLEIENELLRGFLKETERR